VSENFPNNLGNPLVLTNTMVNFDGDKGTSFDTEIEESGSGWEGVHVGVGSGVHGDEVDPSFGAKEVDQLCETGQALQIISGPFVDYAGGAGHVMQTGDPIGPKFIQTKEGVFGLEGPSHTITRGVQITDNHVFIGEAHLLGKRKKPLSVKHAIKATRTEGSMNRGKSFHKGVLPELPPNNKLRKFNASNMHKNRSVRRKKTAHKIVAAEYSTDSIQSSETPDAAPTPTAQIHQPPDVGGFRLEVVLRCISNTEGDAPAPRANFVDSGMDCLIHSEDVVTATRSASERVLVPPTRQIMEAKRVMQLQEDVGIVILENKEDHLKRIVDLEERDQAELEGLELNREIRGSQ
jgi:hypothetical protein